MPKLIITVDLEGCRCSSQIQKLLCCIQECGEFVIEKVVHEKDKVIVSGPFDAEKLSCKLWCKAGRIIKSIEVCKPEPEPEPEPEPSAPCKLVYPYCPYPYPCPQPPGAWPPSCPTPHSGCQPKPPAPPPKQPSCYCSGYTPPCVPPSPPVPYPMVVCEGNPPYGACTVM